MLASGAGRVTPMRTAGFEPEASTQPSTADATADSIPTDTAYMILKNQRRREVLRYLTRTDDTTTLDALARHIAAKENGIDERALSSSQRKRVYIGLYQAHLPKMDDARVIEFDKHRGRIELRPEAEQLVAYLSDPRPHGQTPRWYLVTSLAVGLLAGVAILGPVEVPGLALMVLVGLGSVTLHAAYSGGAHENLFTSDARSASDAARTDTRRSE